MIFFDEQFKATDYRTSIVGDNSTVKDHYADLQNLTAPKSGYVYIYCSNETPVNVFFDNLQVLHTRGAILEETHYYPFGLIMKSISSQSFGSLENKNKYNGIEQNNDLDLNMYDAFYRNLDPQINRWCQIDPKIDKMESWSPYASNYDNPINFSDRLGDEPGGPDDPPSFWKGLVSGALDGIKSTLIGSASHANAFVETFSKPSLEGFTRFTPLGMVVGSPTDMVNSFKGSVETGWQLGTELKSGKANSVGHAVGFIGEKVAEIIILKKITASKTSSGLGDLTKSEVRSIQNVVDISERPLEVVGSAAKGTRRGVGSNAPVGKGPGTKSDIDYVTHPANLPYYMETQNKLPGIDVKTGVNPGVTNPFMGPGIRFFSAVGVPNLILIPPFIF